MRLINLMGFDYICFMGSHLIESSITWQ